MDSSCNPKRLKRSNGKESKINKNSLNRKEKGRRRRIQNKRKDQRIFKMTVV